MTSSFMTQASPPSFVQIKNEQLFNSLFQNDDEPATNQTTQHEVRSDYMRSLVRREQRERELEHDMIREKRYLQHKILVDKQMMDNSRKVRERISVNAQRKEENFRALKNDLVEGRALASNVGRWLKNSSDAKLVKKKKQYDTWNEEVYGTISTAIDDQLSKRSYKSIHSEKLKHFDKFLEVTNAKGSVFRDIIIESEYDPLVPNRNCIKVTSGRIKDPIKRSIQRTCEEKNIDDRIIKTRETLDVLDWATGKIEATPHGFFAKMMSGNKPKNTAKSKTMESRVAGCLDQYNIARGKGVLDKEFPRGKGMKMGPDEREDDFLKFAE